MGQVKETNVCELKLGKVPKGFDPYYNATAILLSLKCVIKMVRRRLIGGDLRMCMAFVCLSVLLIVNGPVEAYKIGVGRADCTGPSVEVIFVSKEYLLTELYGSNLWRIADDQGKFCK